MNGIRLSCQEGMSILIQIDIVDYDNLSSLGMRITKYVNSNLRDIVRVLIDILETDPEFALDGFFPRDDLMRKPQECRNAVNELSVQKISGILLSLNMNICYMQYYAGGKIVQMMKMI